MNYIIMLFLLLFAHCLCDYPLQGDFLAKGKNHKNPIPGVPWYQCLIAHALIHGGAVLLITGSPGIAFGEVVGHAVIDFSKSQGVISFNEDQALHIAMKAAYVLLMAAQ